MKTYYPGDSIQVKGEFRNALTGALADPSTVALTVKAPHTVAHDLATVRESLGVYTADVVLTESGTWIFRWSGKGNIAAVTETTVVVQPLSF